MYMHILSPLSYVHDTIFNYFARQFLIFKACISYIKNLSLVTGEDGIFRSRGGLFTQYRGRKFKSVPVTSDSFFFLQIKMEQMSFMYAFMNALYFIVHVAYEFTHSFINVTMAAFDCNISFINFP